MTERYKLGSWRLLLAVCSVGLVAGCAGTLHVNDHVGRADIDLHGTYVFDGTMEDVMKATVMALETVGFKVTLRNPSRGLLMTGKMRVREDVEIKLESPSTAKVYVSRRQLMFKAWIKRVGPKRMRVELIPRSFHDGAYMGFWPWGRARMRGLWISIRGKIHLALPARRSKP